jgi:hypothetical protein
MKAEWDGKQKLTSDAVSNMTDEELQKAIDKAWDSSSQAAFLYFTGLKEIQERRARC